jgi:putative membrane protein
MYLYIKALHIIFVVTWFAGLFYIVRLFIYSAEANLKTEPEKSILFKQLALMQNRLWYIITWPSAILTLIFGGWLFYLYGSLPTWLLVKLCFVLGLFIYHLSLHKIFKQQSKGIFKYSSQQLRMWNELATLFFNNNYTAGGCKTNAKCSLGNCRIICFCNYINDGYQAI